MSHTWRLEIYHIDGNNRLTFADGDDVSVTEHLGLASQPKFVQERNQPRYLEVRINNPWAVAAWNVMSSSFSLWSAGVSARIGPGAFARYFVTDAVTGSEYRVFQGRMRSPPSSDDDGVVTVKFYDEAMVLGETRDPFVVFANARDRIGDSTFRNGPDIACSFNAQSQITATLPDANIAQPLMRLKLAEPVATYDHIGDLDAVGSSLAFDGSTALVAMMAPRREFYGISAFLKNPHATEDTYVAPVIYDCSWNGSTLVVGEFLYIGAVQTVPKNSGFARYDFVFPRALTEGKVYCFGFTSNSAGVAMLGLMGSAAVPPEFLKIATNGSGSWLYSTPLPNTSSAAWAMSVRYLVERDIPSSDYQLTPGGSSTGITIAQGSTTLTSGDMSAYGRFIRATYYYGRLTVPQVMTALANRAGFSASQSAGFGSAAILPPYYTGTYSYLECLRELADIYDGSIGRQYTFAADVAGNLGDKVLKIGLRYKPWSDGSQSYTLSNAEMDVETSSLLKCIESENLRRNFEAKIGTSRYIGQAFDGSPIAIETDDRRWSAQGSLVLETGSPMQEIFMDSTLSTVEALAVAAEATVREAHVNHVEGSLALSKQLPSLLNVDRTAYNYGQGKPFALNVPKHGLSGYVAAATRLTLENGRTLLELDNSRVQNTTQLKRSMDKSMASESFNVGSLPDTVYIFARYSGTMPTSSSFNRIRLHRADGLVADNGNYGTALKIVDDTCGPSGSGYRHAVGFFPADRANSLTSYTSSGNVYAIDQVAFGDGGSSWVAVALPRPYYVWSHQNIVVDIRGLR
jgi:hypothetical protein